MKSALAVVAIAFVLGACGDGNGSEGTLAVAESRAVAPIGPGPTTSTSTAPESTAPPSTVAPLQGLAVEVVARGLDKPVFVTSPRGDDRLFVVEQDGRIRIISDGVVVAEPFLDIDSEVGSGNLEQGLLGLAFHPQYETTGRFFVHYTNNDGDSRVVEFSVSDDPDVADPDSGEVILGLKQPASNHNSGMLAFGPEGYLYIGFGDGGGANDQFRNGQRTDTLLGTIVRLDIDAAAPYAVPPDNPFVDGGGAPEVWAVGLRNPWRFSIDGTDIYIGDVGQNTREEVDVISTSTPGVNLGWPIFEGTVCQGGDDCDEDDFVGPVAEYDHTEGCSVIGGPVYRGKAIPEVTGHYFYSDWCGGFLRSFRYTGGDSVADVMDWTASLRTQLGNVLSMGKDAFGEIYLMNQEGFLFKLVPVR